MNRDPAYFPDYDDFRPERYLDDSGALCDDVPDTHSQGNLTYGVEVHVDMQEKMTIKRVRTMLDQPTGEPPHPWCSPNTIRHTKGAGS